MTKVIYPSLRLSPNGAAALLDTVDRGFKIYSVPDLAVRLSEASFADVIDVTMSSSGAAVGIRTSGGDLVVTSQAGRQRYPLPRDREHIRALALSDTGDRLALLVARDPASAGDNGDLEIWSLPPGGAPLASVRLRLFGSAVLAANGSLSRLTVQSTDNTTSEQLIAAYTYTQETGNFVPLWKDQGSSPQRVAAVPYGDWVWAVQSDGLVGWRGDEQPAHLPGTPREHVMFSPTGGHMLLYRGEKSLDVTSIEMLFRLIDLSSLKEIRNVTHVVEQYSDAHFALSPDLGLYELRATREGEIQIKELGW